MKKRVLIKNENYGYCELNDKNNVIFHTIDSFLRKNNLEIKDIEIIDQN